MKTPAAAASADAVPSQVARQLQLGEQYYAQGQIDQAIAAYQSGLDALTVGEIDQIAVDVLADLHAKMGNAYMTGRQFGSATDAYKSALRLKPTLTACWCNLGNAQLEIGNVDSAIALYVEALKLNPAHWPSRTNLVQALMAAKQHAPAKAILVECAAERPADGRLRHQLGKLCFELNETDEALRHFQEAVVINPRDADSLYWIGGILQKMEDLDGARAAYAHAAAIQPLIRKNAVKTPPDFRVLALYAPLAGNMPADYLFRDAAYDVDTLTLVEGSQIDIAALDNVQLVVNLISDADQSGGVLPLAASLAEQLGKPVVNPPGDILNTTRDAIAERLRGIPNCRIPKILRLDAGADISVAALEALVPFAFPVLARPAGTHGGDDFEKIATVPELADFLAAHPGDRYVIEYIDYASADGFFRKYRFIFVDGEILPYHLAVGDDWMLHHDSTDMVNQPWMQQQEAAFLAEPQSVFSARSYEALRMIRERIGLDYFGIDCGLDRDGSVVVFEVNASMLVHADNPNFPYKNPFVQNIKRAFDEMLRRRALG